MSSYTIDYFGEEIVEMAVANYFSKNGVNEEVRDRLMAMELEDGEEFFEMVSRYIEGY